jgi:ferredoxin
MNRKFMILSCIKEPTMKALSLRYYSATGNTKRAVDRIIEVIRAEGVAVDAAPVHGASRAFDGGGPDSELLIAFSVFGFGAAHSLRKSLSGLPPGAGRKAHLLAVCGAELHGDKRVPGWPGQALEQMEGILKRRGYELASSAFISYPVNWMQLYAPVEGEGEERLLETGDEEARAYARVMLEGKKVVYRCGAGHRLWNVPVSRGFDALGRRFLGKIYVPDTSCTACGLCAASCPAGAIAMGKKGPRWNANCDGCNRCINLCPEKAIQASSFKIALDLVVSFALIYACFPLTRLILGAFGLAYLGAGEVFIALALAIVLTPPALALLFGPVDSLIGLAARSPGFRAFLAKGPSRGKGRYLAPGFAPGKER